MSFLKGIIFLCLLALAIGFALFNDEPVSLRYYFGWESIPLPLFLWAFVALMIGLIVSGSYALITKISLRGQIRQMKRLIGEMEKKRVTSAHKTG
ncbi:MAG: LapA family protein [Thermodesulfobacteriota bacterium]